MPGRAAALYLSLSLLLFACAASRPPSATVSLRDLKRTVAELSKRNDADSLAAAGLVAMQVQPKQALALLSRAAAAAPDRPDLAWLQIGVCHRLPPCDSAPMEARLRSLDPANGIGWLGLLARASATGEDRSREAALSAISRADRVDIYWTPLIGQLSGAATRAGTLSIQQSELVVIGLLSGEDIPPFRAIGDECLRGHPTVETDVQRCRNIARAMERGDAYTTEMLGNAIARAVWPESSTEWQAAARARRVYEYRSGLLQNLDARQKWDQRVAEDFLALCTKYPREQDVLRERLLEAGEKPEPPGPP